MKLLLIFVLTFHYSVGFSADEITSLPGLAAKPPFRQYSGYLNGGQDIHLHYWFAESQANPSTDPVILWLNGGPMCSSLDGLLNENGPFRTDTNGTTVTIDPHSWNTLANVVWLESPVGVGYSYTTIKNYENTDAKSAQQNLLAIEDFFKKFPQFAKNPFYITGESYAGIYIPLLAVEIFRTNSSINLKGVAIGNGAIDDVPNQDLFLELALGHGFIDLNDWRLAQKTCCGDTDGNGYQCNFYNKTGCIFPPMISELSGFYNVLSDCTYGVFASEYRLNRFLKYKLGLTEEQISYHDFASSFSNCHDVDIGLYLNRQDVRRALHIPEQLANKWQLCGGNGPGYRGSFSSLKKQFHQLIDNYKLATIIVYNGDLDMVCDFLSDQRFVDNLGYKLKDHYKAWRVNGRIGGFVKRYEGITFTTVRGAGHMVPTDQPEAALAIVKELIGIKKLN